ncbi:hypothetical protein F8O06_05235 [Pseudoclavibacter sp. CFCC 14310]|uniref:hypothetical protein n=1 Tax=Pseudoclavibacter sp. CFCC 14310 TaxID=2615180 RepID=UPI0013018B5D|nr:hypothetical protein [Pseudoclavibacter sp. CFCC 14310]KAB1646169.1 hypothetical protein F8O06_05235 [Pseudoclavibacter sp. CFCC 14310]
MTSNRAFITGALLACMSGALLSGCSTSGTDAAEDSESAAASSGLASPSEVVADFSTAAQSQNCDQMEPLLVPGQLATLVIDSCRSGESEPSGADVSLTVVSEKMISDNHATVQAKAVDGTQGDVELSRENVDSPWQIDLSATAQKSLSSVAPDATPQN